MSRGQKSIFTGNNQWTFKTRVSGADNYQVVQATEAAGCSHKSCDAHERSFLLSEETLRRDEASVKMIKKAFEKRDKRNC